MTNREDGTAFGKFIATLKDKGKDDKPHDAFAAKMATVFEEKFEFNDMLLESDPYCTGYGKMGTDESLCRGVLGARFIGLEPTGRTPLFTYTALSDALQELCIRASTPGYL